MKNVCIICGADFIEGKMEPEDCYEDDDFEVIEEATQESKTFGISGTPLGPRAVDSS